MNEFEDDRNHLQCFSLLHVTVNFQGIQYGFFQRLPSGDKTVVVQCMLTVRAQAGTVIETKDIW